MKKFCFVLNTTIPLMSLELAGSFDTIPWLLNFPYHPLVNQSVLSEATANWFIPETGCQAQVYV